MPDWTRTAAPERAGLDAPRGPAPAAVPRPWRRRDLLRAGVGLAALLTAGCGAVPGTPLASGPGASGPSTGPVTDAGAGGVLQADLPRDGAAPSTARGRFLTQSAALYRTGLPGTGNGVLSPYSVLVALGMAGLGAQGSSAAALSAFAGGSASAVAAALTAVDAAVAAALAAAGTVSGAAVPVVESANNLYVQRGLQVRPAYLDALARGYGTGLRVADFAADPGAARTLVNAWVAQRTRQLIPALLPDGALTPDTLLVLVNALYFRASWAQPFRVLDAPAPFRTPGGLVSATYLAVPTGHLATATGAGWRSVSLPFVGDRLALTVILPDEGRFAAVSAGLSAELLSAALFGSPALVTAQLPRFRTDTPTDLAAALQSLGLGVLFQDAADFSGIAGRPGDILLRRVIHQARISVDENGTEAAAATALTMVAGAAPGPEPTPIQFTVDRPFLYVVHDTETGMPFFLGRVTDPRA